MIKAVIFDFFGVVCSDEYWRFVGHDKQTAGVLRDITDEVNSGQLSWREFMGKVAKAAGKSLAEVETMYRTEKIHPELLAYIHDLSGRYKTALLTNAHHDFIEPLMERSRLADFFDAVVISSRVGAIKPNAAIFRYALKKLGVRPEEAVMVDDLKRHVAGARAVGLHTVLYKNFHQMRGELGALLADSKNQPPV